ncbi:MAG TPA: glycosyltransferase [Candidatus Margulisiibacteriota bacterium]|nr:glycosyltransferase [Candidatus Margulisiibacteriota bacterium]
MNANEPAVELSIIIASYNSERTIEGCLDSLRHQDADRDFEIIVIDSSSNDTAAKIVEEKFPEARLYRFSKRKFVGDARNFGISKASGRIIAFVDADCRVAKNWVNEILKNHSSPYLAIGGAIANGNPESYVGWAAYLCEFSQWMPNTAPGWFVDMAGANISYKKDIFGKYGGFIEGTYSSDTEFHWRIGKDGLRIRFIPAILVFHNNIKGLAEFLRHEYYHGRSFARVRANSQGFSGPRRWAYGVCSCFILMKLFLAVTIRNLRNKRDIAHFIKASPLLALGLFSWVSGECAGYIRPFDRNVKYRIGR